MKNKAIELLKRESDLIYDEWQKKDIERVMKMYAHEACEIQRILCANELNGGYIQSGNYTPVITAPVIKLL